MTKMKNFRAKTLATACAGVISLVAAAPAFAYVDFLPPALSLDSFKMYLGNTGGANTITNVDQWDTLGYALSVYSDATHFTDYIVQRLQVVTGAGLTGPASPGLSAGYSIGIVSVVDGVQTFAGSPDYKFTNLKNFGIYLQNQTAGTVSNSLDITTIGNLVTGAKVLVGTGLTNSADPMSTSGGLYGTNSGYVSGSIYQGGFLEENGLAKGPGYIVDTVEPFLQTNAGVDLFSYLAGLTPPLNLVQASAGSNTTPDQTVKNLDGIAGLQQADLNAASVEMYNLFNGLGWWTSAQNPMNDFLNVNDPTGTVYFVQADPGTDFAGVPEPASIALAGLGLLGLGVSRRRRLKAEV